MENVGDWITSIVGVGAVNSGGWLLAVATDSVWPALITVVGSIAFGAMRVWEAMVNRDRKHLARQINELERKASSYERKLARNGIPLDRTDD